MKFTIATAVVIALMLSLSARPVRAATRKADGLHAAKAIPLAKDDVVAEKDKPPKTKKNPNDDKDENPDDGDAGGGNDDKPTGG